MLYIIDGTGPEADAEYNADMERGFCAKIATQFPDSIYLRGPTLSGKTTFQIADIMFQFIMDDHRKNPGASIVLVGHSRGGSACIRVARRLKQHNIKVRAMLLFDAVRRALQKPAIDYFQRVNDHHGILPWAAVLAAVSAVELALDYFQVGNSEIDVIPSNVQVALHLTRNEAFSNYFIHCAEFKELSARIKMAERSGPQKPADVSRMQKLLEYHRNMRDACRFNCMAKGLRTAFSFSNTGMRAEAPCRLLDINKNSYMATHGAMGGAPIEVRKYIDDTYYASVIEAQEVVSMLEIECKVNSFLSELGETGQLMVDYVAGTYMENQSQTKIDRAEAAKRKAMRQQ